MKFVSVRELRNRPGGVWEDLRREDLVVTTNGKPVGILVGIEGGDVEETLRAVRLVRARQAVSRLRRSAQEAGVAGLSDAEIAAEIREARRRRPAS